jgi:transposase
LQKINYKKGRTTTVNALIRKLAVIVWNMIDKDENYKPPTEYISLDEKGRFGIVTQIKKRIAKFELLNADIRIINA